MAEVDGRKRYVLFSKADGRSDAEKPCAFFVSPAGCRNGSKCKFSHGASVVKGNKEEEIVQAFVPAPVHRQPSPVVESVPVPKVAKTVQVQSQDKIVQELQLQLLEQQKLLEAQMKVLQKQPTVPTSPAPVSAAVTQEPRKDNKRKQGPDTPTAKSNKSPKTVNKTPRGIVLHQPHPSAPAIDSSPILVPPVLSARSANTLASNVASDDDLDSGDDENDFLFGAVNHVLSTGLQSSNNNTPHKSESVAVPTASPFVSNDEAVNALHTSKSNHALHGSAKKNIFAAPKAAAGSNPAGAVPVPRVAAETFDPLAIPLNSLDWEKLVEMTKANPRYVADYTFPEDPAWVKARPFGPWCANKNLPRVLAMDCEMCETTDPISGNRIGNALIRFSVVDYNDNGNVLIDAFVAPGLPISDTRTRIHGITKEQLANVTWTLRHAQAALYNISCENTIFVGHALYNDMKSLKFNHTNVIDTAYLFSVEGEPRSSPSLRDVSVQILGNRMDDTHDSVEDARGALYAAAILLTHGPQRTIIRTPKGGAASSSSSSSSESFSLLVHRVPDFCTEEHVQEMIVTNSQVVPSRVMPITRNATDVSTVPSGRTYIYFSTQQHRDLAFESISGPDRPDKQNRSQKRVYFKAGGYICIRK